MACVFLPVNEVLSDAIGWALSPRCHKVNFIGFIKNKSLLVTLTFENNNGMRMQAGEAISTVGMPTFLARR